ncbi:hypothetical protein DNFV4_03232 [Nitrospira tepida]|uniref:Uncharacterized protein n=1 Tax=Nitrospira tepida TaxID=2973512 RepID=A0AA86N156_9BACT|nr:hypothetical protein DNFV4_03232 [Nitrospira tepida]
MSTVVKQLSLQVCYVCGLVREPEPTSDHDDESLWHDLNSYLERHRLRGNDYKLTHGYCPVCIERYALGGASSADERELITDRVQPITRLILRTIGYNPGCSLEALMQACLPFTWNQILLEVDRLSRTGEIQLSLSGLGRYTLSLSPRRSGMAFDALASTVAPPDSEIQCPRLETSVTPTV